MGIKDTAKAPPEQGRHAKPLPSPASRLPVRIAQVVGARPNFVTMTPVVRELRLQWPDGLSL
jgi:hypothetical protein